MTANNRRRSRRWVFTINNPTEEDDPRHWEGTRWVVWQREQGLAGTPHYQGLVVFLNTKTLSAIKRFTNDRAHWEIMRGTLDQAEKYCTKEDTRLDGPYRRGAKPQPGKRNDLYDIKDMIDSGSSIKEVRNAYYGTFIRYRKALVNDRLTCAPKERGKPTVFILWGASGTGKTRLVHEVFPKAYWKPKSKWWDGYQQEDVVVFDEFYGWLSLDEILRVMDRYPLFVEKKGSVVAMTSNTFVFTSNTDPYQWYRNMPQHRVQALFRRFSEFATIVHFE